MASAMEGAATGVQRPHTQQKAPSSVDGNNNIQITRHIIRNVAGEEQSASPLRR